MSEIKITIFISYQILNLASKLIRNLVRWGSPIRKAIRNRKIFPSDQSALKVVYLAVKNASKRWTMPLRDWKPCDEPICHRVW